MLGLILFQCALKSFCVVSDDVGTEEIEGLCTGITGEFGTATVTQIEGTVKDCGDDEVEVWTTVNLDIPATETTQTIKYLPVAGNDVRFTAKSVEKIDLTTEGEITINDQRTIGSVTVTLEIEDSVTISGSQDFGDKTETIIELTKTSLSIDADGYSKKLTAKIEKEEGVTDKATIWVPSGFHAEDLTFREGEVEIKEKLLCIGTAAQKDTAISACKTKGDKSEFEFSEELPDSIGDKCVYIAKALTLDEKYITQKGKLYTAGDGSIVIPKVDTISIDNEGDIKILIINDKLSVASTSVTIEMNTNSLTISGSEDFGETGKTSIQLKEASNSFNTDNYNKKLRANIVKGNDVENAEVWVSRGLDRSGLTVNEGGNVEIKEKLLCIGTEAEREAALTACEDADKTSKFEFSKELPDSITDDAPIYTTIALDIDCAVFNQKPVLYTIGDISLSIINVEEIGVGASQITINNKFKVASPSVSLTLKAGSLVFSGTTDDFGTEKTTIILSSTPTVFVAQGYSGIFTANVNAATTSIVKCSQTINEGQKNGFTAAATVSIEWQVAKEICTLDQGCTAGSFSKWESIDSYDTVNIKGTNIDVNPGEVVGVTLNLQDGSSVILSGMNNYEMTADKLKNEHLTIEVAAGDSARVEIVLTDNNLELTTISGSATVTGLTVTLKVKSDVDKLVIDASQLDISTAIQVSTDHTGDNLQIGCMKNSAQAIKLEAAAGAKLEIVPYTEEPTYCLAEADNACDALSLTFPYSKRYIEKLDSTSLSTLDTKFSSVISSYYSTLEIDLAAIHASGKQLTFKSKTSTLSLTVLSTSAISCTSSSLEFDSQIAQTQTYGLTIASGTAVTLNVKVAENKLKFTYNDLPGLVSSMAIVLQSGINTAIEGNTGSADQPQISFVGEGTYSQGENVNIKHFTVDQLLSLGEVERIIICPEGSSSACLTAVQKIDSDATEGKSLFYAPSPDGEEKTIYSPLYEARQQLDQYVYLGFSYQITVPVDSAKVQKIIPVPTSGAMKLLTADPTKLLYKGATDLTTNGDKATFKGSGNTIEVDGTHAPESFDVEVGDRLNIQQSGGESHLEIDLLLTKDNTNLVFGQIAESGAHLNLEIGENQKVTVYTGSGTEADIKDKVLLVTGDNVKYEKGSPDTSSVTSTTSAAESKKGLSGGAIAGIVIACVVVVAAAVVIPIFIIKKKKASGVSNVPV